MKTWKDLESYLIDKMDLADDQKSKANPTFNRNQMWNHYIGMCVGKKDGESLPIKTGHILVNSVKKDF